jgi:hypothetical protein
VLFQRGSVSRIAATMIRLLAPLAFVSPSDPRQLSTTTITLAWELEHPTIIADRDLIERHVDRVIVKPQALEVRLAPTIEASAQTEERRPSALDINDNILLPGRKASAV